MSIKLTITILNFDGSDIIQKLTLSIPPGKTTENLKFLINEMADCSVTKMQRGSQTLDEQKTLAGNGIQNNDEITAFTNVRETTINIIAQLISSSANNKPVNIRCSPSTTTEQLKQMIQKKISFNASDVYYTCNGEELKSGRTLAAQGIINNTNVAIGVRVRGGH